MEALPYHRLARASGRYRWWRPLVELVAYGVLAFIAMNVTFAIVLDAVGATTAGAAGMLKVGLVLAVVLPVAFLAARIAGRPAGTLSSVAGRVRWRWLGICALAALGFLAFSFGLSLLVNQATGIALGPARGGWVGWDEFLPLALVVVAVIPFQAAAEEYGFRGVLLQAVGAWVSPPVVAIAISSVVFGFVHGLPPPGFVAIASFGVVAAWLAIRTGGLEAALAVHVLNNVTHFLLDAATGRGNVWVSQLNAHITWPVAAIDVVSNVLYGVLIVLLYRRFMEE